MTFSNRRKEEFCPPLDPSLFSALISDYDLTDRNSLGQFRQTLKILKENASAEDTQTFDPSGTSGSHPDADPTGSSSELARSWHGDFDSISGRTDETDPTDVSLTVDGLDLNKSTTDQRTDLEGSEALAQEKKCLALREMFPNLKEFDIQYALRKSNQNFHQAVEDLLNQAFFAEEGSKDGEPLMRKGIDGFAENAMPTRSRKGRGKKGRILRRTSSSEGGLSSEAVNRPFIVGRWDRAKEEVEFISQRTYLPIPTISSVYHKNGGSLSMTIAALCDSGEMGPNPYLSEASSESLDTNAAELMVDFPSVSASHASALIRLSHPSTSSAHELSRALLSSSQSSSKILPQYAPRSTSPNSTSASSGLSGPRQGKPTADPNTLANARDAAFSQAQASYRKSRSDRLMGGAAAYYSSVGRDASASLRKHEAAAADNLVSKQSRPGEVDLHGVNVQDAVRIASQRAETWWANGASEYARAGKARMDGLRIVTGQGHHSAGGRGRLGPAVARGLVKDGWKIEVGQGVLEVVGRARV